MLDSWLYDDWSLVVGYQVTQEWEKLMSVGLVVFKCGQNH